MSGDVWFDAIEHAAHEFARPDYHARPDQWVTDTLGEHLWSAQREIFQSLRDHRYTAVQSCHDSGKSYAASRAVARWLCTHPPGEAFAVTTAPTAAQVGAILWREIGKAHQKGALRGKITMSGYPSWKLDSGELVGYGRKPADYDQAAFQGIHARFVLVVIDEAGGVDKGLFDAVDALVTNENARVLAIGNPDDPGSHFKRICQPDSGWRVLRIDGLRTPNMTRGLVEATRCAVCASGRPELLERLMTEEGIPYSDEPVPESIRPLLLSPLWVEERLHRWVGAPGLNEQGVPESLSAKAAGSALFTAKVRGVFPDDSSEGVLPLGWLNRAVDRWRDWCWAGKPQLPGRVVVGVDVARGGADETCLFVRQGVGPVSIEAFSNRDTMATVGRVDRWVDSPEGVAVVDVIGIGAGVVDRLRELGRGVVAFNASERPPGNRTDSSGKLRFANMRSAAWWHFRELLDPSRRGGSQVLLPDDDQLIADLSTPRFDVREGGVLFIEPKDEIRKRLGRSTDRGDACVQSWLMEATPLGLAGDGVHAWNTDRDRDRGPVGRRVAGAVVVREGRASTAATPAHPVGFDDGWATEVDLEEWVTGYGDDWA